jgi:hypothetical protein
MQQPRRFSALEFVIVAGLINVVINVGLGWFAILPPATTLPLFATDRPSIVIDLIAMAFGITSGTAFFVTPQVRGQFERGLLLPPSYSPRALAWFARWPENRWRRAFQCGVLGVALFAPVPLLGFAGVGVAHFDKTQFLVWKAVFSFIEGGVATPVIAAAALAPRVRRASTTALSSP